MFGRKKMYKKGLADAMGAYEAFGKKQEAALAHVREEVRNGNKDLKAALASLGEDLNGIYMYLNSQEKAALYQLSTPMDIKELDTEEKRLLLAILYQLAENEGPALTNEQRAYIRSVQKYLEITNPEMSADLSAIEKINLIDVQKTFMRVILEFFYLQDGDELSDEQDAVFDYFSVNEKQATIIENEVIRLFNIVGPEGIAEKYGYVSVVEVDAESTFPQGYAVEAATQKNKMVEIPEDLADEIVRLFPKCDYIETEHYVVFGDSDCFFRVNKETKEWTRCNVNQNFPAWSCMNNSIFASGREQSYTIIGDTIYYADNHKQNAVYALDVNVLSVPKKIISAASIASNLTSANDRLYFIDNNGLMEYDIRENRCSVPIFNPEMRGSQAVYATPTGVYYSYLEFGDHDKEYVVAFYEFATAKSREVLKTKYSIANIIYADTEKIYLVYTDDPAYGFGFILDFPTPHCAKVILKEVKNNRISHIETPLDIYTCKDERHFPVGSAYTYQDGLFYGAENGSLKAVNYQTDEITEISQSAINRDWWRNDRVPTALYRLGNYVYYEEEGSSGKETQLRWRDLFCKVDLNNPGTVKTIETYEKAISGHSKNPERQNLIDSIRVEYPKH